MVISVLLVPFSSAQRQQSPLETVIVEVLETVIVEFNKRFGDGIIVNEFKEGPGRQPQGYTKVGSILV